VNVYDHCPPGRGCPCPVCGGCHGSPWSRAHHPRTRPRAVPGLTPRPVGETPGALGRPGRGVLPWASNANPERVHSKCPPRAPWEGRATANSGP
jgi:hypothetical protein